MVEGLIEWIDQRPSSHWWGLIGVIIFCIAGGYYYFIYMEQARTIRNLHREVAEMRQTRDEHQKIADTLEEFQQRVAQLDQKFNAAKILLPESREIPELLTQISKLGTQVGLEFSLFKPEPEVEQEFYADVPVSLEMRGTFHNVVRFFDAIGKLPRIVNVTNFEIRDPTPVPGPDGEVFIKTRGSIVTFRFLDTPQEGERPQRPSRRRS